MEILVAKENERKGNDNYLNSEKNHSLVGINPRFLQIVIRKYT
jgi:hypothetical protein